MKYVMRIDIYHWKIVTVSTDMIYDNFTWILTTTKKCFLTSNCIISQKTQFCFVKSQEHLLSFYFSLKSKIESFKHHCIYDIFSWNQLCLDNYVLSSFWRNSSYNHLEQNVLFNSIQILKYILILKIPILLIFFP